ncbi:MAG: Ig-like domain-containing protein [Isosphaeraceae bacterium]
MPDNGVLTAFTYHPDSQPVDTFLRIWWRQDDGTFQLIGSNDDASGPDAPGGSDSFLSVRAYRGSVLYIGVSDWHNAAYDPTNLANRSGGSVGTYTLDLNFYNNDLNGSIDKATDITGGSTRQGIIGGDGFTSGLTASLQEVGERDVDFLSYTPGVAGVLRIDAQGAAQTLPAGYRIVDYTGNAYNLAADRVYQPIAVVLRVFDAKGTVLATASAFGSSLATRIDLRVDAGVTYYVGVSASGNLGYNPLVRGSGQPGPQGGYTLAASMLDSAQANALLAQDNVGPGSSPPAIGIGGFAFGNVGRDDSLFRGPTDYDPYSFVAARSGWIRIDAAPSGDFGADTMLRVFDAAGNPIAANDDADAHTAASTLLIPVQAGQAYTIAVSGRGNASYDLRGNNTAAGSTGDYTLSVTEGTIPTSISLALSATTIVPGQAVTLTATVATSLGQASGLVTFYDGPTALATVPLIGGVAGFTTATLGEGRHYLAVAYAGEAPYQASGSRDAMPLDVVRPTVPVQPTPLTSLVGIRLVRKKDAVTAIVIQANGAIDPRQAQLAGFYTLFGSKTARGQTVYRRPILIQSAAYDPAAGTITLRPRGLGFDIGASAKLTIPALFDGRGRLVDGDRNGTPGGTFTALLTARKARIVANAR